MHYMIDPLERIDAQEIEALIAQQRYFVLHAPRQTGKTTSLLALVKHLNARDKYQACYANIEGAQTARQDVAEGLRTVCGAIERGGPRAISATSACMPGRKRPGPPMVPMERSPACCKAGAKIRIVRLS